MFEPERTILYLPIKKVAIIQPVVLFQNFTKQYRHWQIVSRRL